MNLKDRTRSFSIVTYVTFDDIKEVLDKHNTSINHFAFICHDKDETDTHFHILIQTVNALTLQSVLNWFNVSDQNTFIEVCKNRLKMFQYLTHTNKDYSEEDGKHKYDEGEIISDSVEWWLDQQMADEVSDKNKRTMELLQDMMDGTNPQTMVLRYGRDYVLNYNRYKEFCEFVLNGNANRVLSASEVEQTSVVNETDPSINQNLVFRIQSQEEINRPKRINK